MKILHIIPSVGPARGGASKAALDMVKALCSIGVNAEIACTNDNGDETLTDISLGELISYQGVPVRFFAKTISKITAINEFSYSNSFKNWLKNHIADYDVVHCHALFSFCSTYAMRLARKRGIAYIAHPIGHLEAWSLTQSQYKKKLYLRLFELNNLQHANRVHFTAESEAFQASKIAPEITPLIIPLGLELPTLLPSAKTKLMEKWSLDSDVPILVFLARIHPKKGLEVLLQALTNSTEQSFQLLIAGDGQEAYINQLKSLINELQLEKHCHFIGYTSGDDKDLLLQGADLFALTSHSENFGIAVLEALANGTAALVTRGVALAKQVEEYDLGFVTPMTVKAVSNALNDALASPKILKDKGLQARGYVEKHHQWTGLAKQLKQSYQTIIAEKTP